MPNHHQRSPSDANLRGLRSSSRNRDCCRRPTGFSRISSSGPRISRWHSTRLEPRSKRTVQLPEIMMIGRIRLRKTDEQVMLSSFEVDVTVSRSKFASKHAGQLMYLATSSLVIRLSLLFAPIGFMFVLLLDHFRHALFFYSQSHSDSIQCYLLSSPIR